MEKLAIIKWQACNYFIGCFKNNVYEAYNTNNFFEFLKQMETNNYQFGPWTKKVKKFEKFIIFDSCIHPTLIEFIKKTNPYSKIYFYFWNPVNEDTKHHLQDSNIDYFCTFDLCDAKKYSMKYVPQFYTNKIKLKTKKNSKYDICFLGRDKGREQEILNIKNNNPNLKTNFIIVKEEKDFIPYKKYLNMIKNSKCILDIVANKQIGLSLKPLEALFFDKKLITNNKDIINYDFYRKENIYILGYDYDINNFINSDIVKIDSKIKNQYDMETWIKKIIE